MSAITLGFPEFEARLEEIRARLNRLRLQDAACVAGSALLLAISAVLCAAFLGTPETFSWVTRIAVLAILALILATVWHVRTHWLDLERTALLVDNKASLEARATTMLAHPRADKASATRSILLWQIFEMAPRWEIEQIAPRTIRRPAIALLLSSLICAAVLLLLPDAPATPPPELATASPMLPGNPDEKAPHAEKLAGLSSKSAQGLRQQQAGASQNQPENGESGGTDGSALGTREMAGKDAGKATRDGDPERAPKGATDQGDLERSDSGTEGTNRDDDKTEPQADMRRKRKGPPPVSKKDGADQQSPGAAPDQAGTKRGDRKKNGSGSKAARDPRLGKSGASQGLLGKKGAPSQDPRDSKAPPMLIELKAFAASVVPQTEPQGKKDTSSGDTATSDAPSSGSAPLEQRQRPDSPLIRSAISRMHEDLMRDLFTPRD